MTINAALLAAFPHILDRSRCSRCGVDMGPDTGATALGSIPLARLCDPCDARSAEEHRERRAAWNRDREEEARARSLAATRRVIDDIPSHFRDFAEGGLANDALPLLARRIRRPEAIDDARAAVGAQAVVLVGAAGAGKTTLAAALVGEVVRRGLAGDVSMTLLARGAEWMEASDIARARRAHRLGDGEAPVVETAMSAPLLVIDDLGQEPHDDRDRTLHDILWHRHASDLHTIWTTYLSSSKIEDRYGSGFHRRLTERGHVRLIRCGDPSSQTSDTND